MKRGFHENDRNGGRWVAWSLVGDKGAVHAWAQFAPDAVRAITHERTYGGIECHFKSKPYEHYPTEAPIKDCWLTGCDCWADGSSLAYDKLRPLVEDYADDIRKVDEFVYAELESWYRSHFGKEEATK